MPVADHDHGHHHDDHHYDETMYLPQAPGDAFDDFVVDPTVVTNYTAIDAHLDNEYLRWNFLTDIGAPVVVTYSFTEVPSTAEYNPYGASSYWAFDSLQQGHFRAALDIYEAAAGVLFVEVEGDAMINAFGASGTSSGGWADYAFSALTSTGNGNLVSARADMAPGEYGFQVLLHELGHAMGLSHPHDGENIVLDEALDTQTNTVMTYNLDADPATELGVFDIEALQVLYGTATTTADWSVGTLGNFAVITASDGAETVLATGQDTRILARGGDDVVWGREGNDHVHGGTGRDSISGGTGDDTIIGGGWHDEIFGDLEIYSGLGGNDSLSGGTGDDSLYGGYGNDFANGGGNDDLIDGGYGNDTLRGGRGDDQISGGHDDDNLVGSTGNDTLNGNQGDDRLNGGYNNDLVMGESGNDTLFGAAGDDTLDGGADNDDLRGSAGNDSLMGGFGADTLRGQDGNDTLNGGDGADIMYGGRGADVFEFGYDDAFETNRIVDFRDGEDLIRIQELGLTFFDMQFTAVDGGRSAIVSYSNWFELEVSNTRIGQLTEADFIFA